MLKKVYRVLRTHIFTELINVVKIAVIDLLSTDQYPGLHYMLGSHGFLSPVWSIRRAIYLSQTCSHTHKIPQSFCHHHHTQF